MSCQAAFLRKSLMVSAYRMTGCIVFASACLTMYLQATKQDTRSPYPCSGVLANRHNDSIKMSNPSFEQGSQHRSNDVMAPNSDKRRHYVSYTCEQFKAVRCVSVKAHRRSPATSINDATTNIYLNVAGWMTTVRAFS